MSSELFSEVKARFTVKSGVIIYSLALGSGPAGLSAAIYAQRENLKAVVVEKEFMGTGQIAESKRVDNYPGL